MILLIDNYDSFVYNLYQFIAEYEDSIIVRRNDEISINEIETLDPSHIIISPGPKRPTDAGICIDIIRKFHTRKAILGICLGHQCIGQAFSAEIVKAETPVHGKTTVINLKKSSIYQGLPNKINVTRYHSLIIDRPTLSNSFNIIAETSEKMIMGIEHKDYPIIGLQYHPESILSSFGKKQIHNFLEYY